MIKTYDVYNKALEIYSDDERTEGGRYNDMQRYLMSQVNNGINRKTEK